jgi:hypothetical protein
MRVLRFIKTFLSWLGSQNDYLYPFEGQINNEMCSFKKSHWWKTRIGFRTAWDMARTIDKILNEK